MRDFYNHQPTLGTTSISELTLDANSRDDIPRVLRSLQAIDADTSIKSQILAILDDIIPAKVDRKNGRPGMPLWNILVLGLLKNSASVDYDRLQELANKHKDVRCLLQHGEWDTTLYPLQTIRDNIQHLTPEVLDRINQVAVKAGQAFHQKQSPRSTELYLRGRCDSFVVETHVSFPTDLSLLRESTSHLLTSGKVACEDSRCALWRQTGYLRKKLDRLYHNARKASHRASSADSNRQDQLKDAVIAYVECVIELCEKAQKTVQQSVTLNLSPAACERLSDWHQKTMRQVALVVRRLLLDQKIPHCEKLFSLHQTHTEWISKGKAGVPVELGLRVCVLQDQYGFTLHHQVMEQQTDSEVAVAMVEQAKQRFPALNLVSFDKGFWSPTNYSELDQLLDQVILPKKGKCNAEEAARETHVMFKRARRKHSAVESDINALESRGLDKCYEHGIDGFKRHVALSVLANNLCRWGKSLLEQDAKIAKDTEKKEAGLERMGRKKASG